jgi:hypothetical protein
LAEAHRYFHFGFDAGIFSLSRQKNKQVYERRAGDAGDYDFSQPHCYFADRFTAVVLPSQSPIKVAAK